MNTMYEQYIIYVHLQVGVEVTMYSDDTYMPRYALSFAQQEDFERLARWCNKMYSSRFYHPIQFLLSLVFNPMISHRKLSFAHGPLLFYNIFMIIGFQLYPLHSYSASMFLLWSSVGKCFNICFL